MGGLDGGGFGSSKHGVVMVMGIDLLFGKVGIGNAYFILRDACIYYGGEDR